MNKPTDYEMEILVDLYCFDENENTIIFIDTMSELPERFVACDRFDWMFCDSLFEDTRFFIVKEKRKAQGSIEIVADSVDVIGYNPTDISKLWIAGRHDLAVEVIKLYDGDKSELLDGIYDKLEEVGMDPMALARELDKEYPVGAFISSEDHGEFLMNVLEKDNE